MNKETFRKYALLVLKSGVNLQKGQKLYVQLDACHRAFANILVEEAYKMGAGYVLVDTSAPAELSARIKYSEQEDLEYLPSWVESRYQTMVEEKWARLFFFGSSEPDMAAGLDGGRLNIVQSNVRKAAHVMARACGAGEIAWSGAALPTPKWAAKVFPDVRDEQEAYELLWSELIHILQLDKDDPAAAWEKIGTETSARAKTLAGLGLDKIHFKAEGTDLYVDFLPGGKWIGGGSKTLDGVDTIPNIPTFEVFTTPDYRGTEGKVKVTYPVEVMGVPVKGAWFVFREGMVTDYGADEHKDALDRMFEICPQAKYLGEVALVDSTSPIYQSGKVFHSVLFDENAACHIALGNGYVSAATGAEGLPQEELLGHGVNVSLVHHDFMIGSDAMDVDGITHEGERIPLMRKGAYVGSLSMQA